jgi:hypothetical protein
MKIGKLRKVIYCKNIHSTITPSKWTSPLLHAASYVSLTHKFLGNRSPLADMPDSHALRPLPHLIGHDQTWRLLGAKWGENQWVTNLVHMADGIRPPTLILYLFHGMNGCMRMNVVTLQTTNYGVFFELLTWAGPEAYHCKFTVHERKDIKGCPILQILYNFAGVHLHNLCTIHNQESQCSSDWDWANCLNYQLQSATYGMTP